VSGAEVWPPCFFFFFFVTKRSDTDLFLGIFKKNKIKK